MTRNNLLKVAFFTAVLIAVLHTAAVIFYLYSFVWWFDILLHLLGGFFVGLLSLWFFFNDIRDGNDVNFRTAFLAAFLAAFLIGSLWEIFEYVFGIAWDTIGSYPLDTAKDLVLDVSAAYLAYRYFISRGFQFS